MRGLTHPNDVGRKTVWGTELSLRLVKSSRKSVDKGPIHRTGENIPQSGIYRVVHQKHRLPHEVTLLKDQQFPRCAQCQGAVIFKLVGAVTFTDESLEHYPQIRLYELPVLEDEKKIAA